MTGRRAIIAGMLAGTMAVPLDAQEAVSPLPPAADAPAETPEQPAARPGTMRLPDGSSVPIPPGASVSVIGPDGNPVPVTIGPDGRPQIPPALRAPPPEEGEEGEIRVTGERPRGSVIGDMAPETVLNPLDIRAYGASTLSELLQSLEPQTRSERGRDGGAPIVLVNGKRVASFQEVAELPPEAVLRMEIFPEELALRYGYRPDQKVVNVVTRSRFRSGAGQLTGGLATRGGYDSRGVSAGYFNIIGDTRISLNAQYQRSDPLFENERDIIPFAGPFDLAGNIAAPVPGGEIDPALSALAGATVTRVAVPAGAAAGLLTLGAFAAGANQANATDIGGYRTLLPRTSRVALDGVVSSNVFGAVGASLSAGFESRETDAALGLASASLLLPSGNLFSPFASDVQLFRYVDPANPLERRTRTRAGRLGLSLGGQLDSWLWSFTGNYNRTRIATATDAGVDIAALQARIDAGDPAGNPFADAAYDRRARDEARAVSTVADGALVFSGAPFVLPAGETALSLRAGVEQQNFTGRTLRAGDRQAVDLSRTIGSAQASITLPIASRDRDVLAALGNLSANARIELEDLSDFGTLRTIGLGLSWSPLDNLDFSLSFTDEDGAPTMQQLGNPVIATPNVRTFDFVRGETVDILRIDGGNAGLLADNRRLFQIGVGFKPFAARELRFSASYTSSRINDPIASFPIATAPIEAAFPDRFGRDADGQLLRIDSRPINFARWDQSQIRWGFNFSRPLANTPPGARVSIRFGDGAPSGALPSNLPPGATVIRAQAGSPLANRFEGMLSRFILGVHHSWRIESEILTAPGGPVLDLLDGAALDRPGGEPRHQIDLQAGIMHRGLGAQLGARWRSGTRVDSPAGDLFFADYGTVNVNLFANLGDRFRQAPWLRGTRIGLNIANLFDARPQVRDAAGATPFSYQPAYLDPIGRSVTFSLRKLLR